jgi:surfeit locus 1 family protein
VPYFRPLPILSAATCVGLAIAIALGVWQLQRREVKQTFLAAVETRRAADPISLEAALAQADPSFTRVQIELPSNCAAQAFVQRFQILEGRTVTGADLITAARMPDGRAVLVARGFVPDSEQAKWGGQVEGAPCPSAINGVAVVTPGTKPGMFTAEPDVAARRWYAYDANGIATAFNLTLAALVILRLEPGPQDGGWPRPLAYAQDIPDNHLIYALTWFGLALTLVGVYAAYHISLGRLRWRA